MCFIYFRCIALTAELTNGTLVGIRGCYPSNAGECTNISACNQRNESLPGPVYFKSCVAECCTLDMCNNNLFPMLPELPSPSSVQAMASSVVYTTQASTTPTDPTAAGIKIKALLYLPIFLVVVINMMI